MSSTQRKRLLALVAQACQKAPASPRSPVSVASADDQDATPTRRLTKSYDPMIDEEYEEPQARPKARGKPRKKQKSKSNATDTEPPDVDGDAPPAKQVKVRGKGKKSKRKPVEMLEGEEVPEGFTTKLRTIKITWKKYPLAYAYMKSQYPAFFALSGSNSAKFANATGTDMFEMFEWGEMNHTEVQTVVRNWLRNRRNEDRRAGRTPTTQPSMKTKDELSPFFQKLRGRAPAASQLWAKEHKDQIDESLAKNQYKTRQEAVGALFAALSKAEQAPWYDKVDAAENAKKNNPDAPFDNQKYLRDTLYTTLNNFSGLNWDQFGFVGFQVLYAYRDRGNEIHYDQLTAGSFDEHDEFMLDEAPFEDWADDHLPTNSDRHEKHDDERPRLPEWDDDWNRTQLCDVLKMFLSSVWVYARGNTGNDLAFGQLKDAPATYIPSPWLDAGIEEVENAKFGALQVLYERIYDSQDTNEHFLFLPPHGADSEGRGASPIASTQADMPVIHGSPSKRRRLLRAPSVEEEEVPNVTPKQLQPVATSRAPVTEPSTSGEGDNTAQRSPSRRGHSSQRAPSSEVDGTTLRGSLPAPLDSPTIATLDMAVDDPVTTETEPEIDELLPSDTGIGGRPEDPVEDASITSRIVGNAGHAKGQHDDKADEQAGNNADAQAEEEADEHATVSAAAPRRSNRKRQGEALQIAGTGTTPSKRRRTNTAADVEVASTSSRNTRSKAAASAAVPTARITRARAKDTTGKSTSCGRARR